MLNLKPSFTTEPSSSQPHSTIQIEDNTVLDNLVSHCSGELPENSLNLQKASKVASMEVTSESPQQQQPEQQMTSTSQIPQPTQQETIPESVSEIVVEPSVSIPNS